jgi:hypothetical protein
VGRPGQLWQRVQSAGACGSLAFWSKGQISTHLLQLMQLDSTFRSVARNRFPIEKSAPDGQTYWHQKRRRKRPRPSTPAKRPRETACPQFHEGIWYQPRSTPCSTGVTMKSIARVMTGIAATKPVSRTPNSDETRQARSR